MERERGLLRPVLAWIAVLISSSLFPSPARATITDTGQVFAAPGGSLIVASVSDGTRTVDGQGDGPFSFIAIAVGFFAGPVPAVPAPVGSLSLINGATMTITNNPPAAGFVNVGGNGTGSLLISGGSSLAPLDATTTSFGTVAVNGPGSLCSGEPCSPTLGFSTGQATVTGAGSQWIMGGLNVGLRGNGTLLVSDGGTVRTNGVLPATVTNGNSFIGSMSGATGLATVTGSGSTLSVVTALIVGNGGLFAGEPDLGAATGTLNIGAGGLVTSSAVTIGNFGPSGVPGFVGTLGTGTVNVDGADSRLRVSGPLAPAFTTNSVLVGRSGNGILNVTGGAQVLIDGTPGNNPRSSLTAGLSPSGVGTINVSGIGSMIQVSGPSRADLTATVNGVLLRSTVGSSIGFQGTGTLNVLNAGKVLVSGTNADPTSPNFGQPEGVMNIGRQPGSHGTVLVSGPGSELDVASIIRVGLGFNATTGLDDPGGVGTLTVGDGGLVRAGEIRVGAGSTINGNGGTLQANVSNLGGTISPGASPGVLTVDGDYSQSAGATLVMELAGTVLGTEYDHLAITGTAALAGILDVVLLDAFSPHAGDHFDLLDGTLTGAFDTIDLPPLAPGLQWDTTNLYTTGEIAVIGPQAVPEPTTILFLGTGLATLLLASRRRRTYRLL